MRSAAICVAPSAAGKPMGNGVQQSVARSTIRRKKVLSLYDGFDYMTKAQNSIWMEPTGCGKTGLATGFLLQAINRGYSICVTMPRHLTQADPTWKGKTTPPASHPMAQFI
jgi:hypothetical protein